MSFEIRALEPADAEAYRALRREALDLEEENFETSVREHDRVSEEDWRTRLSDYTIFCAWSGDSLIGMAGYHRESKEKTSHRGHVSEVYVRQDARGTGAAQALMAAVIEAARHEFRFLYLVANSSNQRAVRFYENLGFSIYGRDPGGLMIDGHLYPDCLMMLDLHARP